MTNTIKRWLVLGPIAMFFAAFIVVSLAHAQAPQGDMGNSFMHHGMGRNFKGAPGVAGTVTAINGTTISVQSQGMMMYRGRGNGGNAPSSTPATVTIYSVDASNATVRKDNATSTVSAISVGDMVFVRGTVNGMSVTATSILDGKITGMPSSFHTASGTPPFAGTNITGTVAAVNGSTLTITGSDGKTYSVDATNAALLKQGNATNSISAINIGDSVHIQGAASGTSIIASVVLDNVSTSQASSSSHPGIFAALTNLLSNIFHFRF
jgi:hypothetical protein